ncbi:MAG: protein-L-isoaspartate O-methyltransferase, partial [Crenarchaeota archaeon]|nr:protein-L-isoaspartate O-methyltransferase [Thermoproteota archaeon]
MEKVGWEKLVDSLIKQGFLHSKTVIESLLIVPRINFLPQGMKKYAYADMPLQIGSGQTVSAPHMVAIM